MKNLEIVPGSETENNCLGEHLYQYNSRFVPAFAHQDLTFEWVRYVVKDEITLIGGIVGKIVLNNVVYVDNLFVMESYRNQGWASRLLERLEQEAKNRGCYMAYLDMINPEARDLYIRRGYQEFARLEDIPCPGVVAYYLKKNLSDS